MIDTASLKTRQVIFVPRTERNQTAQGFLTSSWARTKRPQKRQNYHHLADRARIVANCRRLVDVVAPGESTLRSEESATLLAAKIKEREIGEEAMRDWLWDLCSARLLRARSDLFLPGWKVSRGWKGRESLMVRSGLCLGWRTLASVLSGKGGHRLPQFRFYAGHDSPGAKLGILRSPKCRGRAGRGGLRVQVSTPSAAEKDERYIEQKMTGSIYAVANTWAGPGQRWFTTASVSSANHPDVHQPPAICEYAGPAMFRPGDKKAGC